MGLWATFAQRHWFQTSITMSVHLQRSCSRCCCVSRRARWQLWSWHRTGWALHGMHGCAERLWLWRSCLGARFQPLGGMCRRRSESHTLGRNGGSSQLSPWTFEMDNNSYSEVFKLLIGGRTNRSCNNHDGVWTSVGIEVCVGVGPLGACDGSGNGCCECCHCAVAWALWAGL